MAHKVLYRQFRPRTFDEVFGQKHITDVLKRQIETGNVSHAYLFSGPRGTGKTSSAKILACAVNCTNPENGNPCLKCEECLDALSEKFVDIVEMDAASNNGVENIRDIREKISLLPAKGKYKVYIIDEVHMLSGGAFNALLKTLEEPPAHAIFILATTELRKVPKTILSRCQQYDFRRISLDNIINRLAWVAHEAGIKYEENAISAIARAADGGMRDALSMLDMCAASGDVTEKAVTEIIGMADSVNTQKLCRAIISQNAGEVVAILENMISSGVQCDNIMRDVLCFLSDNIGKVTGDEMKLRKTVYALEVLSAASANLRYAAVPKAQLVASFVKASLPLASSDISDIELRLESLSKKVDNMQVRAIAPAEKKETKQPKITLDKAVSELNKQEKENKTSPVMAAEDLEATIFAAFNVEDKK